MVWIFRLQVSSGSAGAWQYHRLLKLMMVIVCVASSANSWISASVNFKNKQNFPNHQDRVAKIFKRYGGLCAPFYTLMFTTVLHKQPLYLIAFLAFGVPAICTICIATMFFIKPCRPVTSDSVVHSKFYRISVYRYMIYAYFTLAHGCIHSFNPTDATKYVIFSGAIVLLLLPYEIPVRMISSPPQDQSEGEEEVNANRRGRESLDAETHIRDTIDREEILEYEDIRNGKIWRWIFVFVIGKGTVATFVNLLGQIGNAASVVDTSSLLFLIFIFSFVGRLSGKMSSSFLSSRMIPPFGLTIITQVLLMVVYFLVLLPLNAITLHLMVVAVALCHGAENSTIKPTVAKIFEENYATGFIKKIMDLGMPIGAFLFAVLSYGFFEFSKAVGLVFEHNYKFTCFILGVACCLGTFLAILSTKRFITIYQHGSQS